MPDVMSLPKKAFVGALLPTCRHRLLADEVCSEGKSNVTDTSGKRGVVMCSDRSMSAELGDATGMLGTAGGEGKLTSTEQDARETPSCTHLRKL